MKPKIPKLIPVFLMIALAATGIVVGLSFLSQRNNIAQNPTSVNITPPPRFRTAIQF